MLFNLESNISAFLFHFKNVYTKAKLIKILMKKLSKMEPNVKHSIEKALEHKNNLYPNCSLWARSILSHILNTEPSIHSCIVYVWFPIAMTKGRGGPRHSLQLLKTFCKTVLLLSHVHCYRLKGRLFHGKRHRRFVVERQRRSSHEQ